MPLIRAAASSVAVILCACSPPADPAPMSFGVLNAACTAERIAAERAAGITVVELPLAWDRYEPEPGQVDPAYVAEVHRKIDTCRAAGMRIVLGPGLQYPPDWVRALPDAVLRGSAGNLPAHGGLDLVFNAAVRDAASSARAVGEHLRAVLYADFPYTARDPRAEAVAAGELRPWAWTADLAAKAPVIAGYRTQVDALFPGGEIPLRPETYYAGR